MDMMCQTGSKNFHILPVLFINKLFASENNKISQNSVYRVNKYKI